MKKTNLRNVKNGWFVGDFQPTLFKTTDVEVAVKEYSAGQREARHYHKIATEITVIVSGKARLNNVELGKGDIVILDPGEIADFETIEDTITAVVKIPGAVNDKYLDGE